MYTLYPNFSDLSSFVCLEDEIIAGPLVKSVVGLKLWFLWRSDSAVEYLVFPEFQLSLIRLIKILV